MGLILSSNGPNLPSEILVSCRPVLFPALTLYTAPKIRQSISPRPRNLTPRQIPINAVGRRGRTGGGQSAFIISGVWFGGGRGGNRGGAVGWILLGLLGGTDGPP